MAAIDLRGKMNGNTGASGGRVLDTMGGGQVAQPYMAQGGTGWGASPGTGGGGYGGDVNAAGAASDPFGYTLGSLMTPWTKTFQAPTAPPSSGGGGGGGMSIPKAPSLNLQDFNYSYRAPDAFTAAPAYQGAAPFQGARLADAAAFNGARMAASPEFRSSVSPFTVDMYRGPDGAFAAPEGAEVERYTAGPAYTGPTDITQDPSYQFRLQQGQQALENSRSAQGTLRGGATLKALMDYGQQAASQEYAAADARGFRNFQQAADERRYGYEQGRSAADTIYGRAASERDRATDEARGAYDRNYQASRDMSTINYGREAEEYDRREQNRQAIESENYGRGFNEAQFNEQNRQAIGNANYGRDIGEYELNEGNRQSVYQMNAGNALDAYRANAETSLGAGSLGFQIASGAYDRNRENEMTRYNAAQQERQMAMARANAGAGNARADEALAYNRALTAYGLEKDAFETNQSNQFNRLYALANLGQNSAGMVGGYGGQYANAQGNYLTGSANAGAAGVMGGANAWSNTLGNLGNIGMQAALYGGGSNAGPGTQNPYYYT